MFSHLNTRTRNIVCRLINGELVKIGDKEIGLYNELETRSLYVLSSNLPKFIDKKGEDFAENVVQLINNTKEIPDIKKLISKTDSSNTHKFLKLGKTNASSFRGLAPAGYVWSHDFKGKSHLLYGPNGCGKSSLLGAICWCLSGRIFRDDCPPSLPESINTYKVSGKNIITSSRPDALTLLDENGVNYPTHGDFWVELQFIHDNNLKESDIWIKRNSANDLFMSKNGETWIQIYNIEDAGIEELDVELQFLMPARVPHIRFGKNQDLIHALSQIVGLDDLEKIAELSNNVKAILNRIANRIERKDLNDEKGKIKKITNTIKGSEIDTFKQLPFYDSLFEEKIKLKDIKILNNSKIKELKN